MFLSLNGSMGSYDWKLQASNAAHQAPGKLQAQNENFQELNTYQDQNMSQTSNAQPPPCVIEIISGYKSISCGPLLLAPLSVLKPDRPAPDVIRLVTPHGQVCWLDKSVSKCEADNWQACKTEVDDCTLRSAAVNRLTSHVVDAAQFPPSTSLAVFLTGVLKQGSTLDESIISVLARTYGIDDVYFFVHVWPVDGWSGSHEPPQLKADIEGWFAQHGLKKLQYHVMVDNGNEASACESDKAWEHCESDASKCDNCFDFCSPWKDIMLTRLESIWDRVMFVESNRRSRFAYVMRMRTHTLMTNMLPYPQLRATFGITGSAMGLNWPEMDFYAAHPFIHDEFWMSTRDLADFFFKNVHGMRVLSYYEETLQIIRVPEVIRKTRPLYGRALSNSDGLDWNSNDFKYCKLPCMQPEERKCGNFNEWANDMMVATHPLAKRISGIVPGIHGCVPPCYSLW